MRLRRAETAGTLAATMINIRRRPWTTDRRLTPLRQADGALPAQGEQRHGDPGAVEDDARGLDHFCKEVLRARPCSTTILAFSKTGAGG
jgi:hypothetical protein